MGNYLIPIAFAVFLLISAYAYGFAKGEEHQKAEKAKEDKTGT